MHAIASWFENETLRYGFMVFWALVIAIVGIWFAGHLRKNMDRFLKRRKVESTVRVFLNQLVYIALLVMVCIIALSRLGVQTASMVAILASISFALVLALQGSLSHLASGIVLVIMRPFKVGDYIEAAGVSGTVQGIEIMFTHLLTSDNKAVAVPNGKILGDAITNFSQNDLRRLELSFSMAYGDSISQAKKIILDLAMGDARVSQTPEKPIVWVKELSDSAVILLLRYWTDRQNLPDLPYTLTEQVKLAFDGAGMMVPVPQREVILNGKTLKNMAKISENW